MATVPTARLQVDGRLLETLQCFLAIDEPTLRHALDHAATLINSVLGSDKVDVMLYDAGTDSLVTEGTSDTPMGRRQHELGLDRQALSNDGPAARVFRTGETYRTDHADLDPEQLLGVVHALGVRSSMKVPVEVDGTRRGVLRAASAQPDCFDEADVRFLAAVACWVGVLARRADTTERRERDAVGRGQRDAGSELAKLTRRQQEVAACIAEGLTNEQIAGRLVLSAGTVANHVEHVLRRLDLRSRSQVAVWAVERGLYRSEYNEGC